MKVYNYSDLVYCSHWTIMQKINCIYALSDFSRYWTDVKSFSSYSKE